MKRLLIMLIALAAVLCIGCGEAEKPAPAPSVTPMGTSSPTSEPVLLDFSTEDIDGKPIKFSDFSDRKVIMVNFWETWCPPCMSELPELERLYEKYREEGFVILGVCSNSEPDTIRSTMLQMGMTYPVFMSVDSLSRYQTQYVPTTVFVNGLGELLHDEPYIGAMSGEAWEEIITGYLGN